MVLPQAEGFLCDRVESMQLFYHLPLCLEEGHPPGFWIYLQSWKWTFKDKRSVKTCQKHTAIEKMSSVFSFMSHWLTPVCEVACHWIFPLYLSLSIRMYIPLKSKLKTKKQMSIYSSDISSRIPDFYLNGEHTTCSLDRQQIFIIDLSEQLFQWCAHFF